MANNIRNTFSAANATTVEVLRRAINQALISIITQLNSSDIIANTVTSLPGGTIRDGRIVYLSEVDGTNAVGMYGYYDGSWKRLG